MRKLLLPIVLGFALGLAAIGLWNSDPLAARSDIVSNRIANSHEAKAISVPTDNNPDTPGGHEDASTEEPGSVRLNQNMIDGESTSICTRDSGRLATILGKGVSSWNVRLRPLLGYDVFAQPVTGATSCMGHNIEVLASSSAISCSRPYVQAADGTWSGTRACYNSIKTPRPPRKTFTNGKNSSTRALLIYQALGNSPTDTAAHVSTMMHELGHALGLTDYNQDRQCSGLRGPLAGGRRDVDPHDDDYTLMARSTDACRAQGTITGRDLRDLYEAYHVSAVERVELAANPTNRQNAGLRIQFRWPNDPLGVSGLAEAAHNGLLLMVMRQPSAGANWVRVRDAANPIRIWASDPPKSSDMLPRVMTVTDPAGRAHRYKIVGLTRGDVRWQNMLHSGREFDETVTHDGVTYQQGDPTIVAGVGVGTARRILSASVSPRYCHTDGTVRGSVQESQFGIWATPTAGRSSVGGRGADAKGLSGPTQNRVYSCGTSTGAQSFSASATWTAAPAATRSVSIPVNVHRTPKRLSLRLEVVPPPLPPGVPIPPGYTGSLECTYGSPVEIRAVPTGGKRPHTYWVDGHETRGTTRTLICGYDDPGSDLDGTAEIVTGFVLDVYGSGAEATLTLTINDPAPTPGVTTTATSSTATIDYSGYSPGPAGQSDVTGSSVISYYYEFRKNLRNEPVDATYRDTSYTFRGLKADTTYLLGFRLVTNEVQGADWVDQSVETFAHEAPTGLNLSVSGTSATLTWTAVSGLSYEVRQGEDGSVEAASGARHTFTGVATGTQLYVRVKGTGDNVDDGGSAWAPALAAPGGLNASSVQNTQISVAWGAGAGAASYDLRYRTGSGTWTQRAGLTAVKEQITGLTASTRYEFQVRSRRGAVGSAWSASLFATTQAGLAAPTGLTATREATALTLHWQPAPGATLHQAALNWSSYTIARGGSQRFEGLDPETEYTLAVRALHGASWSAFATIKARTTAQAAVTAPPQPGGLKASMSATGAVLSWNPAARATSYEVAACADGSCQTETVTATGHTFSGLTPSTEYSFSVVAKNSGGDSAAATLTEDTPALPVPSGLQSTLIAAGLVSLEWTAVEGADGYDLRYRTGAGAWTERLKLTTDFDLVTGLERATRYEFQVRARAGAARSDWSASFHATTPRTTVQPPPEPTGLSVSLTATSASLSWSLTLRATSYEAAACAAGVCLSETTTETSAKITGLTPETSYTFSVVAKNSGGDSEAATVTKSTPAAPASLAAPSGLSMSDVGSSAASLNWARVDGAAGYEVKACAAGTCTQATVSQGTGAKLTHPFTGLTPAALYTFSVRAQAGTTFSDWTALSQRTAASLRIRARKLADGRVELVLGLPGGSEIEPAKRFVSLAQLTDGRWRKSEELSRAFGEQTYRLGRVSVRLDNRVCPAQVEVGFLPASGGARITPTQYRFAVNARVNAWRSSSWFDLELGSAAGSGDGAGAAEESLLDAGPADGSVGVDGGLMFGGNAVEVSGASTADGCAAAPGGLKVSGVTQDGATLSWTAVTDASHYDVRVGDGAETELSSTTTSHPFSGLAAGGTHALEVRARSTGGASDWSSRSVTLPPAEPTNVRVGSATQTSLTLEWDGSAGATSYEVKRTESTTVATKAASNRSHQFAKLTAGTEYTLSVRALNAGGASDWVPVSGTTPQVAPPEWPPRARVSVSLTATGATLSWPAALRATGYTVKACAGAVCQSANVTATSHSLTNLTPSTGYVFSVVASNRGGVSLALSISGTTPAPPVEKPPTPTGLSVTTTATGATLSWRAADRATSYDVSACVGETCKRGTPTTTSQVFSGLKSSTAYTFSVAARNSGGVSTAATLSGTTKAPPVEKPPTPTGLSVTTTATGATLSWRAADRATSYDVSACVGETCKRGTPTTTSQVFSGLKSSTAYTFSVAARNSGGVSTAATLQRSTKAATFTVTGRMEARRVTSGRVELAFTPSGGSRIRPTSRYLDPSSVTAGKWYKSSAVVGTVGNVSRTLGRITARLVVTTAARYFEICFIPQGGTRACPTGRVFFYGDPSTVVNTWYWTGSRSYTAAVGGQVSGVAADELMAPLPAGAEDPAGLSGGAMADLVPPAPADPAPESDSDQEPPG